MAFWTFQTLREMYQDMELKHHSFCPNEAEFRAYMVLMKLNEGDILRCVCFFTAIIHVWLYVRIFMYFISRIRRLYSHFNHTLQRNTAVERRNPSVITSTFCTKSLFSPQQQQLHQVRNIFIWNELNLKIVLESREHDGIILFS